MTPATVLVTITGPAGDATEEHWLTDKDAKRLRAWLQQNVTP